jgi:UDPglucose 6-dehydrogenase
MRVGFIGLGKLGLPVATAMASRGIEVFGTDPHVKGYPDDLSHEEHYAETVEQAEGRVHFTDIHEIARNCSVVFAAPQTPHAERFEGVTPLPDDRSDFDYRYLRSVARTVSQAAQAYNWHPTLAVISTVLPGTMRRDIRPILHPNVSLAYNPSFIAMGTTIRDFLDPEFVLIGDGDHRIESVYDQCLDAPLVYRTSIENAELIKVAYNTFIGLKLAFANTLQEVCHKTPGTDVDEVTDALKLAHRRLISPAYLTAGMGDGGGCHPRDNIALSWLARELDLSYDLFEAAMLQRERHAEWLADLMCEYDLPKGILGTAYKPGSHITTGSPAKLVLNILRDRGYDPWAYDNHVHRAAFSQNGKPMDDRLPRDEQPRVWLVGCNHPDWPIDLPEGSVVIDPWRTWPDQEGVTVVGVGTSSHYGQTAASRELHQAA